MSLAGRQRGPRTAAVAVRLLGNNLSMADVIRKARDGVSLEELGISDTRIRKSANGSLLMEIPGPEGTAKADMLAERLRETLGGDAVVSRPLKENCA